MKAEGCGSFPPTVTTNSRGARVARVTQSLDAMGHRGKEIRLRAYASGGYIETLKMLSPGEVVVEVR